MHRWLLCWMLLVTLAAALVQGQTGTPIPGVVEGTVTNGATDAPIPGARVTLDSIPSGGEPRFIRTDSGGRFQFAGVSPGVYGVSAEQPGLAQCDQAVTCSVGVTPRPEALTRR